MYLHIIPRKVAIARGLIRYLSVKPCPKGHLSERYTGSGSCIACIIENNSTDEKREYWRDRYQANRDVLLVQYRARHRKQSAKRAADAKRWAAENPEKRRAILKAYKARRRQQEAGGDTTAAILEWERAAKKICHWCGVRCDENYHVDHYEPLSKGGRHEIANLVISCPPCNLRKSAKDPYDFAASLGRLF